MTQCQAKSYKTCSHTKIKDFLFFKAVFNGNTRFLEITLSQKTRLYRIKSRQNAKSIKSYCFFQQYNA